MKIKHIPPDEAALRACILQRQPVVVQALSSDLLSLPQLFDNDNLDQHAGRGKLMIEARGSEKDAFGQGKKQLMTLQDFLNANDANLYLSTQQAPIDFDGHPALVSAPLTALLKHPAFVRGLPLRPAIVGNLVPQSINMWMGRTWSGASSGLHHDFHDNLYVLLRGKKRFRLFPPSMAHQMYTHGAVQRVYPNGRIVYEGGGDVLADGSDRADVLAWQRKLRLDQAAEAAVGGAVSSSDEDAALDAALGAALDDMRDNSGDLVDDFEGSSIDSDDDDDDARVSDLHRRTARDREGGDAQPPSFSKVNLTLPVTTVRAAFPDFPGVDEASEVTLEAGQMLYLPAGWFHEVTSFSDTPSGNHLALNYWFHPPDNKKASNFADHPYLSDFWPCLWNRRVHHHNWDATLLVPERASGEHELTTADQGASTRLEGRKRRRGGHSLPWWLLHGGHRMGSVNRRNSIYTGRRQCLPKIVGHPARRKLKKSAQV